MLKDGGQVLKEVFLVFVEGEVVYRGLKRSRDARETRVEEEENALRHNDRLDLGVEVWQNSLDRR